MNFQIYKRRRITSTFILYISRVSVHIGYCYLLLCYPQHCYTFVLKEYINQHRKCWARVLLSMP